MLWLRLSLDQRLILLDLWGTIHEDDNKFGPDSLVPVFTCSQVCHVMSSVMCDHDMSRQVLTSLVVALLVDNEMLSYSEPVSRIWPE